MFVQVSQCRRVYLKRCVDDEEGAWREKATTSIKLKVIILPALSSSYLLLAEVKDSAHYLGKIVLSVIMFY